MKKKDKPIDLKQELQDEIAYEQVIKAKNEWLEDITPPVIETTDEELEQYLIRLEKEAEEEEAHQRILATSKTSVEEIKQLEKEAEKIQRESAIELWMKVFNSVSFCNEVPIRCLFHVFFGQQLKHKKIHGVGRKSYLDWREHLFVIQSTGSGKGRIANLYYNVINETKTPEGRQLTYERIGHMTPQALINTAVTDKNGKPVKDKETQLMKIKYGLLHNLNYVILEEARQLIKVGENKLLEEIFLALGEPYLSESNIFSKTLMEYEGQISTVLQPSMFATTRPLGKIRAEIATSGLFQRTLFYAREVDDETREEMNRRAALSQATKENRDKFNSRFDAMIKACQDAIKFAYDNEINIHNDDYETISSYINEKLIWFQEDMKESISDADTKEILQGFVSRYNDHLKKLAHHSAAIRHDTSVKKQDVEYAFNLLKELYVALKLWVETKVDKDWRVEQENENVIDQVRIYVSSHEGCMLKDLISYMGRKMRKDDDAIRYEIKKLRKGKNKIIEVTKDKKVYLAD